MNLKLFVFISVLVLIFSILIYNYDAERKRPKYSPPEQVPPISNAQVISVFSLDHSKCKVYKISHEDYSTDAHIVVCNPPLKGSCFEGTKPFGKYPEP
jgi:hypothetical protein